MCILKDKYLQQNSLIVAHFRFIRWKLTCRNDSDNIYDLKQRFKCPRNCRTPPWILQMTEPDLDVCSQVEYVTDSGIICLCLGWCSLDTCDLCLGAASLVDDLCWWRWRAIACSTWIWRIFVSHDMLLAWKSGISVRLSESLLVFWAQTTTYGYTRAAVWVRVSMAERQCDCLSSLRLTDWLYIC